MRSEIPLDILEEEQRLPLSSTPHLPLPRHPQPTLPVHTGAQGLEMQIGESSEDKGINGSRGEESPSNSKDTEEKPS